MFGFWIPHLWTFELSMIYSFTNVKVERFLNKYSNYLKFNKNKHCENYEDNSKEIRCKSLVNDTLKKTSKPIR